MFAISMTFLGIGMGLIVSQLGNVVLSAVGPKDRSEAGGLQYTSQQLGSAIGVALIGAIVITGLANNFIERVSNNDEVAPAIQEELSVELANGITFVSSVEVEAASQQSGIDDVTTAELVDDYEDAQISALKGGLLLVAGIIIAAFFVTGGLPSQRPRDADEADPEASAAPSGLT
jgi:hypothetical protein